MGRSLVMPIGRWLKPRYARFGGLMGGKRGGPSIYGPILIRRRGRSNLTLALYRGPFLAVGSPAILARKPQNRNEGVLCVGYDNDDSA